MEDTSNCMKSPSTVTLLLLQSIFTALWEFLITGLLRRKVKNPGLVYKWFFMIYWHQAGWLYHYSSKEEVALEGSSGGKFS